jgi:hypothetical protein
MQHDLPDDTIDTQLKNVTVPETLAARLKELASWPASEIDRDLASVPVPSSLAGRLKDIAVDAPLEQELVRLELPPRLRAELRSIAQPAAARLQWEKRGMRMVAASLIAAVSLGYFNLAWLLLFEARRGPSAENALVVVQQMPVELEGEQLGPEIVLGSLDSDPEEPASEARMLVSNLEPAPPWQIDEGGPPRPARLDEMLAGAERSHWQTALSTLRVRPLGAPIRNLDESPQLDLVQLPLPRGIATPLVPGYDRAFLRRTGVHPPIFPIAHPTLEHSLAPISVSTDSFDRALALAANKRRLPADEVRTEDFIAAMEYRFPQPAPGELGLTVLAGPSQFGPEAARMLALGVKAGEVPQRTEGSTHLVLAIDFSTGLGENGTWLWLQEALVETVQRLGRNDRMTLIFFQREVRMRTPPLDRSSAELLRASLANAEPRGMSDLSTGIDAAIEAALNEETATTTRQIVLLSDGSYDLLPETLNRLKSVVTQLRATGTRLGLLNVRGNRITAGAREFAGALEGEQRFATSRRQLVHRLLEFVHGDQAIAASEVKMLVHFDPQAILAYRLIGHEANTMAQLVSPGTEAELHSGDESVVLFEVLPTAKNHPTVVDLELHWRMGVAGTPRVLKRRLTHSELAAAWTDSSTAGSHADPAFQAAALAAEVAEQLRGSRQALRRLGWGADEPAALEEVLTQARSLQSSSPALSLARLIDLLEGAQ